jgi:hypothetical protein
MTPFGFGRVRRGNDLILLQNWSGAIRRAVDDRSGSRRDFVSGNTLRGKAILPVRVLAESIARELGPKGIYVAYIIIEAVIDPRMDPQAASKTRQTISSSSRATLQRRYGTWLINRDPPGPLTSSLDPSANIGQRGSTSSAQRTRSRDRSARSTMRDRGIVKRKDDRGRRDPEVEVGAETAKPDGR